MNPPNAKRLLEAALFNSPGVVSMREIAKITGVNVAEARVLANSLMHDYESRATSLEVRVDSEGARMAVKEEYEPHVSHMAAAPELHKGMLKTLAFIAYKQPVKQSDVINFRNSKAYEHIKLLREKGFVTKEKKGITYILKTTPRFREYFGKDAAKKQALADKDAQLEKESAGEESGAVQEKII